MPDDLGVSVTERIGTSEKFGPKPEEIVFNGVAVIRDDGEGAVKILGIHYINHDKSMVTVKAGHMRTVSVTVGLPK